ncbi:MAG TPA: ubiquitin-like protein Pup [Actinomycetota bacterium]|nr:ubiquitin-like protein Pup [Actinomycetota bacterium]
MAQNERQQRKRKAPPPKEEGGAASPEAQVKGKRLKEDMDRLLDEIDSVLEENAEEFIKNYVQKGGQ